MTGHNTAPEALPPGAVSRRRTPDFTETTVPPALLKRHVTKAGQWARITVLEGALRYRVLEPQPHETLLTAEHPGIIQPETAHEVEPVGTVRFYVEFFGLT